MSGRGTIGLRGCGETALGHEKEEREEDGNQDVEKTCKELRRHSTPPVRDGKCKGSSEGLMSSSKRQKFNCYT